MMTLFCFKDVEFMCVVLWCWHNTKFYGVILFGIKIKGGDTVYWLQSVGNLCLDWGGKAGDFVMHDDEDIGIDALYLLMNKCMS